MSTEVRIAAFKHPHLDTKTAVVQGLLTSLQPYVVAAIVAPNFCVEPPRAQQTLTRAFDVSELLRSKAQPEHHATKLSGFAVALDGQMPLDSIERIDLLGAWNMGLGTTMYVIEDSAVLGDKSDATLRELNERAKDALPHMLTPNQRVVVARTLTQFDGEAIALFVTANDVAAARQLYRYLAARAGRNEPLLLGTLVQSKEYGALLEHAECARDTLANAYAKALGLKLAQRGEGGGEPPLTSWHYAAVESNTLSHGRLTSSVPQPAGHTAKFFVVYNNATPTYNNTRGVIVSHGIMGGYTVLHTADNKPWYQPQYLSMLPATTLARNDKSKALAQHRKSSERTSAAFDARVTWIGDLGDAFLHVRADEAFESMDDPFSMHWIEKLAPPGSSLTQRRYQSVIGQLSSTTTVYATLPEIARLARDPKTPPGIALALDHPLIHRIVALWDAHIVPSGYKVPLEKVFANTYTSDEADGFRLLSRRSVCRDAAHQHNDDELYKDAARFLQPEIKSETRSLVAIAAATDYNDVEHLRSLFVTSETVRAADFQARTIVTIDKELARLVTLDSEHALGASCCLAQRDDE